MSLLATLMLLTAVLLAGSPQPDEPAPDWPMYQRNAQHTGLSLHVGIPTYPVREWQVEVPIVGSCGESSAGMSQGPTGIVYVSACGTLAAIDPHARQVVWAITPGFGGRSTPAVAADGTVYWGYADDFAAFTPSGKRVWTVSGLSGNLVFGSSPAVGKDGSIYFTHDGIFALSSNGHVRWRHYYTRTTFPWTHSAPAVGHDGTVYVGTGDNYLSAYNPDGSIKWEQQITWNSSPSVGADGTIYVADWLGNLHALTPEGATQWVFEIENSESATTLPHQAPNIGADGTIYFGTMAMNSPSRAGWIYAIKPDGSLKWKTSFTSANIRTPDFIAPLVVDRDGNVFACADHGMCYGINALGNVMWASPIAPNRMRTAPHILSDGKMLFLDGQDLYAMTPSVSQVRLPLVNRN